MSLATYSPEDITILLAGIYPLTGYIDGTFISITKDLAPFESARTSDGRVARKHNNDQSYTIILTLQSTSQDNDVLTKLGQIDETFFRGKFPLLVKDQVGSSLFFSTTTWIEGVPTMDFGTEVTPRVWTLRSSQALVNFGGNEEASSAIQDLVNIITSAAPILEGLL